MEFKYRKARVPRVYLVSHANRPDEPFARVRKTAIRVSKTETRPVWFATILESDCERYAFGKTRGEAVRAALAV